jgi:mono/diheme cytochrome c family protein
MRSYLATCLILAAAPVGAQSLIGDTVAGHDLALRACAECHAVPGQRGTTVNDAVPSFVTIARRLTSTELGLRVFLQTPHPPMPNLMLTRREIDDVVGYILSLK